MDSLINASARALAAGHALGALKHVALRNDAPALALRGIAMAQLGDLARARELLRRAARGFGQGEPLAHARCVAAKAEVALALRDLSGPPRALLTAADTLTAQGDRANALQARLTATRQWLLLGRLEEAAASLAATDMADDAQRLPPALTAVAALCAAELAMRSLQMAAAEAALARAQYSAAHAGIPALQAEVAQAQAILVQPAARQIGQHGERLLRLDEVSDLLACGALVVDACRHAVSLGTRRVSLARRPVLFMLADTLARAWPGDASREALIARAFRQRHADETHRARLRVEVGRLRALVKPFARIDATPDGFALRPHDGSRVAVLAPPIEGDDAALLALLSDGAAWSTSALALALNESQRTVQRALVALQQAGRVRAIGRARAQRWLTSPLAGFTTILLLPASLPSG